MWDRSIQALLINNNSNSIVEKTEGIHLITEGSRTTHWRLHLTEYLEDLKPTESSIVLSLNVSKRSNVVMPRKLLVSGESLTANEKSEKV